MAAIPLALLLIGAAASSTAGASARTASERSFVIADDRFVLDGKEVQIISGSIHYFRIHPAYWRDRLERARAMGLNAIEMYVAWNLHEPYPGQFVWSGFADVERFVSLAHELGLLVLLRPGPYICAEWDFGGFPWWLASSKVAGGGEMTLRRNEPAYLAHVDAWWAALFARLRRFLWQRGGPIVMVQVENEYGFCGDDKDYLRHLVATHLGDEVLLYTTDPPGVIERGTLAGGEVFSVVDFGPQWFDPKNAFETQAKFNPPGKSAPFCSEFYTGWLSHWGEPMANTSTDVLVAATRQLLEYRNSSGSLSFYMVHGGTNFGFWQGANVDGQHYMPHITSYDYDAPISEAGDYCQPGIGGGCKYEALRALIAEHMGRQLPEPPPRPAIKAYGEVELKDWAPLWQALPQLWPGEGILADAPQPMEEYGQRWGLILYRTWLPRSAFDKPEPPVLDFGAPVHDFASVYLDGQLAGRLDRSQMGGGSSNGSKGNSSGHHGLPPTALRLLHGSATTARRRGGGGGRGEGEVVQLDILVEGMGRQNFGCEVGGWDTKGLQSTDVTLDGTPLRDWHVFPLQLDDASSISFAHGLAGERLLFAARRLLAAPGSGGAGAALVAPRGAASAGQGGPMFYRGTLDIGAEGGSVLRGPTGHLADTYLALHGWGKGLAWLNGFHLGWYWPCRGPQMTLYVPGAVLDEGPNELVLLELESAPRGGEMVTFTDAPDFFGPKGPTPSLAAAVVPPNRRRRAL